MRMRFQFNTSVSWMVIFFTFLDKMHLFNCVLLAQPAKIIKKNMLEHFGMESLRDICVYYCGKGDFVATFFDSIE